MARTEPPLRTVAKAFEILDLLWKVNGMGPTELSERMDIPKSTAFGYLRTLESTGFVLKDGDEYRPSFQFLTIGGHLRHRNRFFHASMPELNRLAENTGELPNVAIEEHGECVSIHAVKGDKSLELGIYPGLRTPVHSHATGKVLLAHLPPDYADEVVYADGLAEMTEHTITDRDALTAELETIRQDGYAVDWDQQILGLGTVASPILVDGDLIGAISLCVPTGRIQDEEYQTELVKQIQEAANTIKVNYQYGT